ncbi:hypothetical protein [Microbacterium aquimaris]|uniref:KTSC domain-containing protein n=1 Tax=Microbacterium aquimaris TaxID=459816 RepID=A0ABU5N5E4_9MICO|nr:hypothetical protein [Microbacterium aquimaris]MDZ8161290.1 hypothetical protein [Microbacterium aquimaris]
MTALAHPSDRDLTRDHMPHDHVEVRLTARDARGFSYDYGTFRAPVDTVEEVLAMLSGGGRRPDPPARPSFLPDEIRELLRREPE